jgi:hypothetical protein
MSNHCTLDEAALQCCPVRIGDGQTLKMAVDKLEKRFVSDLNRVATADSHGGCCQSSITRVVDRLL